MASVYAQDRKDALAAIREAGAAVAFEYEVPGAYDDTTGREAAPTTQRASGFAVDVTAATREQGNADRIAQLIAGGMALVDPIELLVAAEGLTFAPQPTHRLTWAGKGYVVREAVPLAPDGIPITFTVVGSRG